MNWKLLERHPISARYPDMKGQAWEDFLEGVTVRSVKLRPIITYEGKILDGWQLQRACVEKGIEPSYSVLRAGEDPEEFVEMANNRRRHESQEMICARRDLRNQRIIEERLKGKSERAIAETVQVSQSSVHAVLSEATEQGCSVQPTSQVVNSKDGVKRPAKKPRKPRRKPPPNRNAEAFDWPEFFGNFGGIIHAIDHIGGMFGCDESPAATELRTSLESFRGKFVAWAESHLKTKSPRFVLPAPPAPGMPPTVEEVSTFCQQRKNKIDPEEFVAFYAARGWMMGKTKMKNWKFAVITWEKSARQRETANGLGANSAEFLRRHK